MRASILVLLTCFAGGCTESRSYVYGPGPDDGIVAVEGNVEVNGLGPFVRCSGPEEELALLGALCSPTARGVGFTFGAADGGLVVAGDWTRDGRMQPRLLFFGYLTADLGPSGDHAADVRWAVVLVSDPPAFGNASYDEHIVDTLASWPRGEPLTGAITTASFGLGSCTENVTLHATLLWRSTTIELADSFGTAC